VWFYQFPRPSATASRSTDAWKSGAIDSLMPEKTHVGRGISERVFPAQAPAEAIRGSGKRPQTAALFPSPIHAKFLSLGKLRKALCQRAFNSYALKIHPHDFKKILKSQSVPLLQARPDRCAPPRARVSRAHNGGTTSPRSPRDQSRQGPGRRRLPRASRLAEPRPRVACWALAKNPRPSRPKDRSTRRFLFLETDAPCLISGPTPRPRRLSRTRSRQSSTCLRPGSRRFGSNRANLLVTSVAQGGGEAAMARDIAIGGRNFLRRKQAHHSWLKLHNSSIRDE